MVEEHSAHYCWNIVWTNAELKRDVESFGKQDPFLVFKVEGREWRSRVDQNGGKTPKWNTMTDFVLKNTDQHATLECWDYAGTSKDEIIGSTEINVADFFGEGAHDHSIHLQFKGKDVGKVNIRSKMTFYDPEVAMKSIQDQVDAKNAELAAAQAALDAVKASLNETKEYLQKTHEQAHQLTEFLRQQVDNLNNGE